MWKTAFKKLMWYGLLRKTISLQMFERLSSTNFTWSILQYFVPYDYFYTTSSVTVLCISSYFADCGSAKLGTHGRWSLNITLVVETTAITHKIVCFISLLPLKILRQLVRHMFYIHLNSTLKHFSLDITQYSII